MNINAELAKALNPPPNLTSATLFLRAGEAPMLKMRQVLMDATIATHELATVMRSVRLVPIKRGAAEWEGPFHRGGWMGVVEFRALMISGEFDHKFRKLRGEIAEMLNGRRLS